MSERELRARLAAAPRPGRGRGARADLAGRRRRVRRARAGAAQARRRSRAAVVAVAALAVALAVLSPPGRAVIDSLRAGDRRRARRARALLAARARADRRGRARRRVGRLRRRLEAPARRLPEASWSPFGRFVVAARAHELAALEPDGTVRWTLARPRRRLPALGRHRDRHAHRLPRRPRACTSSPATAPATPTSGCRRPRASLPPGSPPPRAASCCSPTPTRRGRVHVVRARLAHEPLHDGARAGADPARVVERRPAAARACRRGGCASTTSTATSSSRCARPAARSSTRRSCRGRSASSLAAPDARGRRSSSCSTRAACSTARAGELSQVVPSPDGRRLLLAWPAADQWVFVRTAGGGVRAVANVAAQLGGAFPTVGGWSTAP